MLSAVPMGACRPCPISRKERHGKHDSTRPTGHRRGRHPPGSARGRRGRPDRPAAGHPGFPASTRGYVALVTWAERFGPVERIGVEGTGTYGAGLTRFVRAYGLQVVEVNRPDRSIRRRRGKSDPIDAQAAARATLAGIAATTPKTREGQVEMIRVLRVARRGALKARVAAAEQLYGVLYSAPEELRQPLLGLKTKALVGPCAAMRPGPLTSPTGGDQDQPADLGPPLAATPGRARPARPPAPGTGRYGRPHPGRTTRGRGRHRRAAAGHRRRQPPAAPLRGFLRAPVRHRPDPGVLGPHPPPPAQSRRRPPGQQRPVADRPGPDALPPTDQGLCPAPHQTRTVQARHHALPQALHRPRDLPPPHQPPPTTPPPCPK